ncbi:ImmA/IrrE family metallo-endopeptidase [Cetobacterium sp. 2A]|uniref:ImmA/IrrE family metallo-endopeptidase n=1 Tax=Cetobacterium sp. 2A TaxID=2754723 RepID=UPI00163C8451|nr:ImmA/IrrE family metallo-endopeptidase [Cetobacterium sp. 2A]MBC2855400.1 ImmA/IrrE family metallo-endopeptidase [Cetobacterium sp. 2A]
MNRNEKLLAVEARINLGIGLLDPIESIENLIFKKTGISIIKKRIPVDISGICSRISDGIMAILVNTSFSIGRQNFTIAHEYYHLMYDKDLDKYEKEKEARANTFASYFIMPEAALDYYLEKKKISRKKDSLTPDDVIEISAHFKMSYLATIVRLEKNEKLLSKEKANEYIGLNAKELAVSNGIFTDLYDVTEEEFSAKTDYVEEVKKALENEKITVGKYEALLLEGGFEDVVFGLDENDYGVVVDGRIEDYM